ncbi:MAG TPA: GFA family protein [Xanthomonadales bacterium]|nr:GFA family protein [Xanthomonadales bacterium]
MSEDRVEGGCACRAVRYRLRAAPLFVNCCHCSWCQRETGSAFVVNAMIETANVELLAGEPILVDTPSASGKGQKIARCATCHLALWSHYPGGGPKIAFVRVGTLDSPSRFPPDAHIYTSTKLPWVALPDAVRAFPEFYDLPATWPATSMARIAALRGPG